jgi:hypothetical protein
VRFANESEYVGAKLHRQNGRRESRNKIFVTTPAVFFGMERNILKAVEQVLNNRVVG